MISRFFKGRKRLDAPRPADRLAAVEALSDTEARARQTDLITLAGDDDDQAVRAAALARIVDPGVLHTLFADPRMGSQATSRMAKLVESGTAAEFAAHPEVLRARLAAGASDALIQSILDQGDVALLLDAALICPRAQASRLLEHQAFHQTTVLQELERRSRDHDKRTNRFARERLDTLRRDRNAADSLIAQITARLETLEKKPLEQSIQEHRKRHAIGEVVTADLVELAAIAERLAVAGEPLATATLNNRMAAWQRAEPPPPAPEAKTEATAEVTATPTSAPDADADGAFEPLTEAFLALERALSERADFPSLAAERQTLTDRWLAQADHIPPNQDAHQIFERVSHRYRILADAYDRLAAVTLPAMSNSTPSAENADPQAGEISRVKRRLNQARKVLKRIDWPDWAPRPAALDEFHKSMDAATGHLASLEQQSVENASSIAGRLTELERRIEAGELNQARSEAGAIRTVLRELPEHLAQPLNRQLAQASSRLADLSDWQTYATSPKRESLCASMAELAEHPLSPKDQANRIKELREEWNALGPIVGAADHKLFGEFNEAAERAFEPCRAYFAELAELRAQNLAAREEICTSLAAYLANTDWQNADFKAAERIMRTAREEWRKFHPVDRGPGKAVETRFEALQSELHDRIKAEWDRNLARKADIVAKAQALTSGEQDGHANVETVKNLQQQWQAVGATPRRQDQALWQAFRQACDAVFEAREAARRSADETQRSNQQQTQAIVEEFRKLLADDQHPLDAAMIRDFQTRYDALPPLPERLQRPLDREFSELLKSARLTLNNARLEAERARLFALKALDAEVSALEQRQRAGEILSFDPPDPVFAERWSLIDQPVPLQSLHRLVIEAEIAAELESAEADRDLRMGIQVEMMNAGLGRQALEADVEELTERWCRAGPKDVDVDPLRERFFLAIEKLASR